MRVQDLPPYTYKVFQDAPSGEYVAECQEIPGLSGIGETAAEAMAELQEAVAGWLEVLAEQGERFPAPESPTDMASALRKTA
jgi:predicted RNase H-like HicB family nuclease